MIGTGWLHLEAKDFKRAEEAFQALIEEPSAKNDAYGWLGLACLNFASAPSHQRLKVSESFPHAEQLL